MNSLIKLRLPNKYLSRLVNNVAYYSTENTNPLDNKKTDLNKKKITSSPRVVEFQKKLREKTPIGKLEEHSTHPFQEKQPLKRWPNSTNPHTGEIGGPAGPEPTRYGDWERKGRVSDF